MSDCLTELQIKALAGRGLDMTAVGLLEPHLTECSTCMNVYQEWQANLEYAAQIREALVGNRSAVSSLALVGDDSLDSLAHRMGSDEVDTPSDYIFDYQIIREIHRGGQGIVYEAIQLSTKRTVALKVLLEGAFASRRDKWMFEREVKLVAALRHPNIVVIHDSGIIHGKYYFAMDYVSGKPLDTYLRMAAQRAPAASGSSQGSSWRRGARSGSPARRTITLFKEICDAIAYAHRRGVIHRDLKPLNILVSDEGVPCVLDFGMAKVLGGDIELSRPEFVSHQGDRMGTLHYMSPEQTLGQPDKIDTRTDIYSLGVILYELLTGTAVYDTPHDIAEAFRLIREQDPPKPSRAAARGQVRLPRSGPPGASGTIEPVPVRLDADLDAIVMKCLEKKPARRYQSASELSEDLAAWLDCRPIAAKSASSFYVIRKLAVRHSFETLVILAMLLGLGGFGGVAMYAYRHGENALARAATSDRAKVDADWNIAQRVYGSNLPDERRLKLGWFLLEWQANRTRRARTCQASLSPTTPEYAATAFLLNETITLDQLLAKLPLEQRPLACFVAGERAYKSGHLQQAIEHFDACMQAPGDGWMKGAVQARLEQLRPTSPEQKASTSFASP